jgi:hypothetical protein
MMEGLQAGSTCVLLLCGPQALLTCLNGCRDTNRLGHMGVLRGPTACFDTAILLLPAAPCAVLDMALGSRAGSPVHQHLQAGALDSDSCCCLPGGLVPRSTLQDKLSRLPHVWRQQDAAASPSQVVVDIPLQGTNMRQACQGGSP